MSTTSEDVSHPIFHTDPAEYMQYVYKEICVLTEDGMTHTGRCYTVDPVSQSIVLIKLNDDNTVHKIKIVMGHCIEKVTELDDNVSHYKSVLDGLFRVDEVRNKLSADELGQCKENLRLWLLKNRIPVTVSGENEEVLNISDALFIHPPYQAENCASTNEIILGRVQGLIKNMPKDQSQW